MVCPKDYTNGFWYIFRIALKNNTFAMILPGAAGLVKQNRGKNIQFFKGGEPADSIHNPTVLIEKLCILVYLGLFCQVLHHFAGFCITLDHS